MRTNELSPHVHRWVAPCRTHAAHVFSRHCTARKGQGRQIKLAQPTDLVQLEPDGHHHYTLPDTRMAALADTPSLMQPPSVGIPPPTPWPLHPGTHPGAPGQPGSDSSSRPGPAHEWGPPTAPPSPTSSAELGQHGALLHEADLPVPPHRHVRGPLLCEQHRVVLCHADLRAPHSAHRHRPAFRQVRVPERGT